MSPTPELRERVDTEFGDTAPEVMERFDAFQPDISPEERERVLSAILILSKSNRAQLDRYLKVATRDYREVLIELAEAGDGDDDKSTD